MINNSGIINIGNNNQNVLNQNVTNLILELDILSQNIVNEMDKEYIKEIIKNLKTKNDEANKSIFQKLSKKTFEIIEKLSLTLITDYLKMLLNI